MVYTIDPLQDPRWAAFVNRHSAASVFHTAAWLEALQRTYGYTPVAYTTSPPSSPLANAIVLCQVRSWLTGRRMVSLPFSDHCDPLLDSPVAAAEIAEELKRTVEGGSWKYVELRPRTTLSPLPGTVRSSTSYLHTLDLRPALQRLFLGLHKDCVQRKIRRAEREGLTYECGNSGRLLNAFYRLTLQTRRRQQLPPQPVQWFRNLATCMGERLQIRVAFHCRTEIAAVLTVQHRDVVVYKYGCSSAAFRNLGAMPFLLWNTILEAKAAGLAWLDLGRSDADNPGLLTFKDRWGATRSELAYLRWSRKHVHEVPGWRSSAMMRHFMSILPDAVLQATGRILYPHVG